LALILSDDGREVLMQTDNLGKIYIPKSEIRSIKKLNEHEDFQGGKFLGEGVFTTRYQFTTNSFPIKKGEHYAMVHLYGPEVHFSVADNFSIGVMTTWAASPFVVALKYTLDSHIEKLHFGFGTLLGSTMFLNRAQGLGGLHWGMATYGSRRNNVTLSAGYGYFNFDFFWKRYYPQGTFTAANLPNAKSMGFNTAHRGPILGLGGMFALNDRVSFIFDAMFVHTNQMLYGQEISSNYGSNNELIDVTYGPLLDGLSRKSSNFIFMPSMRFQRKPNRAFQVSLTGVIGKTTYTYLQDGSFSPNVFIDRYSFPIPNCTWFFNF
jgi:hypothetical protein